MATALEDGLTLFVALYIVCLRSRIAGGSLLEWVIVMRLHEDRSLNEFAFPYSSHRNQAFAQRLPAVPGQSRGLPRIDLVVEEYGSIFDPELEVDQGTSCRTYQDGRKK